MNHKKKLGMLTILAVFALPMSLASGENIDPSEDNSQYAYGVNVGWLNFDPITGDGVQVASNRLTGWVWGENIGWISLSCENTSSCKRVSYGVANDGNGNLSGFAWGENVGWINFDPRVLGDRTDYGVIIDADGNFDGWAWGESTGWIRFDSSKTYNVQACVVTLEDLANFASKWLTDVDTRDFAEFAQYWLDFCPDGWEPK